MVEIPTEADIPAMLHVGKMMHGESRYSFMEYDGEKVAATIRTLLGSGFVRVVRREGEIIGGMIGYMGEPWFSREPVAGELALFVIPDRRGGMAAAALVNEFVAWATERGAREITLAISAGVRVEETGRLYERLGFDNIGGVFKRRV